MLQGNLSKYIAKIPHISHETLFFSKPVNYRFNNCQGTDGKVRVPSQGIHTERQDLIFLFLWLWRKRNAKRSTHWREFVSQVLLTHKKLKHWRCPWLESVKTFPEPDFPLCFCDERTANLGSWLNKQHAGITCLQSAQKSLCRMPH